jgi:hypothetical protein
VFTAASFRRMVKAEKRAAASPKRRAKRRMGTFHQVLGAIVDATQSSEPSGRAPP